MKAGKTRVKSLSNHDKELILENIAIACVKYAGDSYSDFARETIKILQGVHVVEYGDE